MCRTCATSGQPHPCVPSSVYTEDPPYQVNPTTLGYLDSLIGWADEVGVYIIIHLRTGTERSEAAIVLEGDPLVDLNSPR